MLIPRLFVRRPLQALWDPVKLSAKSSNNQKTLDENDLTALNMQALTAAVRSTKWWVFTMMLACLHRFVQNMCSWAEDCPCHDWLRPRTTCSNKEQEYSTEARALEQTRIDMGLNDNSKVRRDGVGYGPCPMAGMRAVQLALGLLADIFRGIFDLFLPSVMDACEGLTDTDLQFILNNWEHARAHLLQQCLLKMEFWGVLPWRALALGDWDAARLRATAASLIEEFERCPIKEKHHRVTWELFRHDSPYRLEIEALADGAPMSSLPLMKRWASEALFTPTAERRQEATTALSSGLGLEIGPGRT